MINDQIKVERRRELRRLAATRGSFENDRLQRLTKLKAVTESFQDFDVGKRRLIAKRLSDVSLSLEGGASALLQQGALQLGDLDAITSFPEQKPPLPPPLYPVSSPHDVPVRIEHFLP